MAKVPFSKLKCKIDDSVKEVKLTDDIVIEVKQYLPIQEKLELIGNIVMQAHEQDENYSNPVKAKVFEDLEIIFAFTNLSFTDKQKEDLPKLYDMLFSSGIINKVIEAIPTEEIRAIDKGTMDSINAIYKYQNSIMGILNMLKDEQNLVIHNVDEVVNKLNTPSQFQMLTDILENFETGMDLENVKE